jgi:hypothetical protein
MTATRSRIGHLITTIQGDFLDTPGLGLTLSDAIGRFAIDKATCEALLAVLVDTGVLTKDRAGHYIRYFPPRHTAAA